jgi:hypothetical protein
MNEFFAQLTLARNDDLEGWMNILFLVIIAVFWALGGIIKAKARKNKAEEETPSDETSRGRKVSSRFALKESHQTRQPSPVGLGLSRQYRRQIEQLRRKINGPRPVVVSLESQKKSNVVNSEKYIPAKKAGIAGPPEYKKEPIISTKIDYRDKSSESVSTVLTIDSLFDYTNPDDLKRAILHYEILGKPLSLRSSAEQHTI